MTVLPRSSPHSTLDARIHAQAVAAPTHLALRTPTGDWTYGQLIDSASRIEEALSRQNGRGDVLGIVMTLDGAAVATLLACVRTHRPVVLLPGNVGHDELHTLVEESSACLIALPDGAPAVNAHDTGAVAGVRFAVPVATGKHPELPASIIQLTSGSLGPSRFAVRTLDAVTAEIDAVRSALHMTAGDRVLCASSLAHSYGLIGGLLAPLTVGAQVIVARDHVAAALTNDRPTILFGLGSTYRALVELGSARELEATRLALSAGAPLPAGLFEQVLRQTGVPVRQDYGTTETGTISVDVDDPDPSTVGTPLDHIELRLGEPAAGVLEVDEIGEIQIRSRACASGYFTEGQLKPCVDADGWYHTGDVGSLDERGRLRVGRRLRAPISVGGTKIPPERIECGLLRIPGIQEAVAMPADAPEGATIKVIVVGDVDPAVVRQWIQSYMPDRIPAPQVERRQTLPRSPAGKLLHKYLL